MALISRNELFTFDPTPAGLLEANPCLQCLSEKEILAALVGVLAVAVDTDIPTLMSDSACFTCMSKKQMLQALTTVVGQSLLDENDTVAEVIERMHCLVCSDEKRLLAAILYLLASGNITISVPQN